MNLTEHKYNQNKILIFLDKYMCVYEREISINNIINIKD